MKKALALLLVLCAVLGLVACAKPAPKDPSVPTTVPTTTPTTPTDAKPFAGKTLSIYGIGWQDYDFTNYDEFDKNDHRWMIRAAIDEWAAINEVTIQYGGFYRDDLFLGVYGSEKKIDLFFQSGNFPKVVKWDFTGSFTQAEYNVLAEVCGDKRYLDVMKYTDWRKKETASYGIVLPWTENMVVYFNQSLFARYNVKSPLDYYNEGIWNWDNFAKCMAEISRDTNNDGINDIYGLPGDSWQYLLNQDKTDASTGKKVTPADDPWVQDFIQMKYDAYNVTKSSKDAANDMLTNTEASVFAMQISECLTYDYASVFRTIPNGDKVMALPLPRWEGENGETKEWLNWPQLCAHVSRSSKEREATLDLLSYVIKCGMKYMSDYSLGTVKCDYAGIQGTVELSKKFKNAFADVVKEREAALKNTEYYDATHMKTIVNHLNKIDEWYAFIPLYARVDLLNYEEITKLPPAESIPIIRERHQEEVEFWYNEA